MRRLGWLAVGVVVLAALLGPCDGPGRIGVGPDGPRSGAPGSEAGGRLAGAVTHVRDGDTLEAAGVAVRIANLDCAERDTAEGWAAQARMREPVAGQEVACELEGRRSHDRKLGTCALAASDENLGEALIAEGRCERWRSDRARGLEAPEDRRRPGPIQGLDPAQSSHMALPGVRWGGLGIAASESANLISVQPELLTLDYRPPAPEGLIPPLAAQPAAPPRTASPARLTVAPRPTPN